MSLPVFPSYFPGIKLGVKRTRLSSTTKQNMVNGQSARVANILYPMYSWDVDFSALHNDNIGGLRSFELQTLMSFCSSLSGSFGVFTFADTFSPDYSVTSQFIANGDGHTTVFPLYRTFGTVTEPVYVVNNIGVANPNYGWKQFQTYLGGVVQPTGWTLNADTGTLTFSSAPGLGVAITADFAFMWKVVLADDSQEFTQEWSTVWSSGSPIRFTTTRQ